MYWIIASIKTVFKLVGLALLGFALVVTINPLAGLIIAGLFGIVFLNMDDVIVLIYITLISLIVFSL